MKDNFDCIWEVSTRAEEQKGFAVGSKRWIVERTFAWIGKYHRLSKDYEFYENKSGSLIYIDLIRKMLRNLTAVNAIGVGAGSSFEFVHKQSANS